MNLFVKKGDYGYIIQAEVRKADTSPYSLNGFTVKMKVWVKDGALKWTIDGTITDPTSGKVDFPILITHFTDIGTFDGEIELTKSGVVESTRTFSLIVRESL